MKPPKDHLIKRPATYRTAEETRKPGYLQARFAQIRAAQQRTQREDDQRAIDEAAAKVQPIRRKGAA